MKHRPEASKQPLDLNCICKLCGRNLSLVWMLLHAQDDDDDCDGSLPEGYSWGWTRLYGSLGTWPHKNPAPIEVDDRSCA